VPELPEVETICRALRPHLVGRYLRGVRTFVEALRQPLDRRALVSLVGRRIVAVRRRAKFLLVEFTDRRLLLMHLGMSGSCRICPDNAPRRKHEHIIWELDNGQTWRYGDPRRFGLVQVQVIRKRGALPSCLCGLPPEPLSRGFNGAYLASICRGRSRPIKSVLLDQTLVAGVGNIYASEALHRAGISPVRRAATLSREECARLAHAIRTTLRQAIAAGGTTIADFRSADGSPGGFQVKLFVYGREGEPCRRCRRGRIRRLVLSSRSTYYCPDCQR